MIRLKIKMLPKLKNNRGSLILTTYLAIVVLLGLGAAFLLMVVNESRTAERQRLTAVAFHIAEAGIERALYDLRQDFINDATPSWSDADINGYPVGPDLVNFYDMPYDNATYNGGMDNTFNDGSYDVDLKNDAGGDDIWVKSTGTIGDVSHTLQVYVKMIDISPWANAIFAGAGASGTMVNGNVDVRGSVHILGTNLTNSDYAIDMGGTSELVGNNYNGVDPLLVAKVPTLPTTTFNGETVETLNAKLRIKNGLVGLSGSATVGEADVPSNAFKETVDGVFVTHGYGGSQGAANVYSDNGTNNPYDLGGTVIFPSLSDPHPDDPSKTVQEYFKDNSLILTNELSSIDTKSAFSYSDANGSISMDGNGNMAISGQVYIDGNNDVLMGINGSDKTITYSGRGTLLVTGNAQVNVNLVTSGNNSFPSNIMGIMTPNNVGFNEANIDVMGVFYAEDTVVAEKQTDIMGTIVSNHFNMGTNVPAIFQVPETANNLPPGIISTITTWYMVVVWQKVAN